VPSVESRAGSLIDDDGGLPSFADLFLFGLPSMEKITADRLRDFKG
jgi:hypothetical protein